MTQITLSGNSTKQRETGSTADRVKYVYLTSCVHSGSTLVGCLLGAHPDVSTVGEFGAVLSSGWDFRCSCGETLGHCDFWRSWQQRAECEGIDFDPGALGVNVMDSSFQSFGDRLHLHLFPHRAIDWIRNQTYGRWPQRRRKLTAAIEKSAKLARIRCWLDHTKVFVDTAKPPGQVPLLARCPAIDLKLISLVRDGRGVMKSQMHRYGYTSEHAISNIVCGNKFRLRAEAYLPPDRIFRLRLEDLWDAPEEKTRELKMFVGVDPDAPVDYANNNRHVIGNLMRLKFDGIIRRDDSWKTFLTKDHLALFEARAGRLNRSFGYES